MFDLLFIGGSSVDIVLNVPRLPSRDEKLLVEYAGHYEGGMVANAACASARLGMRTAWAGTLGDDENGRLMIDSFHDFGVDTSMAQVLQGVKTDFTVILLDPSGERTILVVPTTPVPITLDANVYSELVDVSIVYTLPQPENWFLPVAEAVHAGEGLIAVDVESSAPVNGAQLKNVIRLSDLVFCSRGGLALLSSSDDPEYGAKLVLEMGPELVCVTLGKLGAWVFTADENHFSPGFSVPVTDTTGAGDSFHAAFLYGYLKKRPLDKVLQFANAAASLSVQALGARGVFATAGQVEAFLGTMTPVETGS